MDHLKRKTLDLGKLTTLVLDEADEMLHMGFIDDVEWILEQTPSHRQVALFSATLPAPIRRIAQKHLRSPVEITIRSRTSTANNIRQRYWVVGGMQNKLDALTRILEAETFDAMLVFARTKQATVELAEKLGARGFSVDALNGDIQQNVRERTIARLKSGQIDILVATDVAARGLDVDRISHVVNYDVPYDTESYVHRIGRTGRAGRSGEAILFISPREKNMLRVIERATRQSIEHLQMPTAEAVNQQRIAKFKERIAQAIESGEARRYRFIAEQFAQETATDALDIAAALVSMAQGRAPLLLETGRRDSEKSWTPAVVEREVRPAKAEPNFERAPREDRSVKRETRFESRREIKPESGHQKSEPRVEFDGGDDAKLPSLFEPSPDLEVDSRSKREERDEIKRETFRIEVGLVHGVKPGNIVGAIANEAGLEGKFIGRVDIREDHSFVDLPEGMPKQIFRDLQKTRVAGQELRISRADAPRPKHAHHLSYKADRPPRSERPHGFSKPLGISKSGGAQKHKPRGAHKGPRPSRPRG
jgi:ATP-dependent RNA helicase DeaD